MSKRVFHDLACVVHVHSTFSDGTATAEEIVDAARATGADAVLLTDHDTLEARRRGLEAWHGSVMLLVGVEISPRGGHFLAFGLDEEVDHRGRSEAQISALVRAAGALGFAAHPFSEGSRISTRVGRPHPWPALERTDYTGIELWSLTTDTAERCETVPELLRFLRDPEAAMDGPPEAHVAVWDRLCRQRRVVAIGGLDAHQSGIRLGRRVLSPLPNRRMFRLLRTHVLCDRAPTGVITDDRGMVYAALAEGRCYLAVDVLADPKGFAFWADAPGGRLEMGGEAFGGEWTVHARLPQSAELRLIRDGEEILRTPGTTSLDHPARQPGVYRVEAQLTDGKRPRTWIVSNPLYLRDERPAAPQERQ